MDSAMDRITGDIVSAEELWLLDQVDHSRYVCRGCGRRVVPASHRRGVNKVRPYFSIRNGEHAEGCDVSGEPQLVERGKREQLSSLSGKFPAPYPSRLRLRDQCPVHVEGSPALPAPAAPGARAPKATTGDTARDQGYAATTIRPLCRFFLNYKFDRHVRLHVDGIAGSSYFSVFKQLKRATLERYPDRKLFYAAIRWAAPVESTEALEVMLDAGERDARGAPLSGRVHILRVEWADWSEARRRYVRDEIEVARREARDAHRDPTRKGLKAWLFFIGEQDADNFALFRASDHRLVCCLFAEMSYPPQTRISLPARAQS